MIGAWVGNSVLPSGARDDPRNPHPMLSDPLFIAAGQELSGEVLIRRPIVICLLSWVDLWHTNFRPRYPHRQRVTATLTSSCRRYVTQFMASLFPIAPPIFWGPRLLFPPIAPPITWGPRLLCLSIVPPIPWSPGFSLNPSHHPFPEDHGMLCIFLVLYRPTRAFCGLSSWGVFCGVQISDTTGCLHLQLRSLITVAGICPIVLWFPNTVLKLPNSCQLVSKEV